MDTSFKNQKIFVAGLGWLGLPLALHLSSNYSIGGTVSSNLKAQNLSELHPHLKVFNFEAGIISSFFQACNILIFTIPPGKSQTAAEILIQNTISAALKTDINRAIYISSTSVYGNLSGDVTEDMAHEVVSPHSGLILHRLEKIWLAAPLTTTVLRMGGLFGPNRNPANFFQSGVVPNPQQFVNMTSQKFAINTITAILNKKPVNDVFNCVSHNQSSRIEFYREFNADLSEGVSNSKSRGKRVVVDKLNAFLLKA